MGEIAEDMIDGTCCELCGCYFESQEGGLYTHEHPAVCWECWMGFNQGRAKSSRKS